MIDDKTRLPDLTPRSLRFGGLVMILFTAAVPALAWTFAASVLSLAGLFVGASAWAAIALVGYLAMGRNADARTFALLICGCGALWAVVLTAAFWFLVRGQLDVSSPVPLTDGRLPPGEIMALCGIAAAATGATYGYFSAVRYRDLPRTFTRALRAFAWALLPSVALCLAVFGTDLLNRYVLFAVGAPLLLAMVVTGGAAAMPRRTNAAAIVALMIVLGAPSRARAQHIDAPATVVKGLDAFMKSGGDSALNVWAGWWPASDSGSVHQLSMFFSVMKENFGAPRGYEIVANTGVGARVRDSYVIIWFDLKPVYMSFRTYQTPQGDWHVLNIGGDSDMKKAWPSSLLDELTKRSLTVR